MRALRLQTYANGSKQWDEFLKAVPEELMALASICRYKAGSTICLGESPVKYVHLVLTGTVSAQNVTVTGKVSNWLHMPSPTFIGDLEVLAEHHCYATNVVTSGGCVLARWPVDQFMAAILEYPKLLLLLSRVLAKKNYGLSVSRGHAAFRPNLEKTVIYLLQYCETAPPRARFSICRAKNTHGDLQRGLFQPEDAGTLPVPAAGRRDAVHRKGKGVYFRGTAGTAGKIPGRSRFYIKIMNFRRKTMKKFFSALLSLTMLLSLSLPAAALDQPAVDFVIEQGYMLGTGGGFEPDGAVTRAMACQVLYNMAGQPKTEGGFAGAEGQWYASAAAWAKEAGLVSGDGFDGSAVLSGGELTGMLAAYAAKNGRVLPEGAAMYGDSVSRGELAKALYGQAPWSGGFTETKVSISANGRKITAVVTMPEGDGKFPAVVMNHGHGGSKDEGTGFAGIARALADKGIASIRMDFPSCGESPEPFTKNYLSNMVEDSNACRDYLAANYSVDTGRLGVLGYSMGGRITSTIISQGEHGYQAVALLASAVGDGEKMAAGVGGAVDPEQFPAVYAEAQEKGYYRVTTPYGKVQDLAPQWFDDLRNIDPLKNAGAFTGPVLVMYGDKDDVVPPEVNKLSLNAYPNAKEIVVPGANHSYAFYQTDPKVTAVVEDGIADFFAENLVSAGSSEKAGYSEKTVTFSVPEQDGVPAHEVVGTLTLPDGADGAVPAVVMLHGTGSNRHEAGNGYDVAAPLLAEAGLASLRIDFMGAGDSKASDVDYSPTSANIDAKAAADYLAALEAVDGDAIGIMGWSQGGMNAMLAAAAYPDTFKAVVTWAGATGMKGGDFAQRHETAKKDGYTVTEYDWREPMRVGLRWYDDMAATDVLEKVAGYPGPILAIQGEADVIVVPETAGKIVEASTNSASKTHMIKGCDHTFNVFSGSFSAIEEAAGATAEYMLQHLKG